MKKKLLIASSIATLIILGLVINSNFKSISEMDALRKQHATFLENSPFKETQQLSKTERKAKGLPPNSYNERMWELTMDPATGKPEKQRLFDLQESLKNQFSRVPGENSNAWEERGPDNVGGRTRAIMYDPNDVTNKRVFAGGVSGGLWVNNDITSAASAWTEVGIPQNLAITCITYDPNNTNTFYIGTGESYVQGDVNGNGVWKSTDGGSTWNHIFGGATSETIQGTDNLVTVNSPGNIAGDNIYIPAAFGAAITAFSGNLVLADNNDVLPTEACSALTNAGAINGNIAVIERGNCEFGTKVLNAQNAGAVAVIIINNVPGSSISMGPGAEGGSVNIPSLMISQEDGAAILTELGNNNAVNVTVTPSIITQVPGVQYVNDIKIRDLGAGNSAIYVAASAAFYSGVAPTVYLGLDAFGLYRSTDNGNNFDKIDLPNAPGGTEFVPNDIEIGADNKVWLSTTNITGTSTSGSGTILSSSDGNRFQIKHRILNGLRTQIEVSDSDPNLIYVLAELSTGNPLEMLKTTDGFNTTTAITPPDGNITPNDFTNGQAYYDLLLAINPDNDNTLFVGGIDLFRSTDGGTNWSRISEAYTNTGLNDVHPDQHALAFNPNDSNKGVFGNDGGIYYASNLSLNAFSISARNNNYNTLQFYKGSIGPEVNNEKLLAGAQDNNSLLLNNATFGINSSIVVTGGDGAYCFIDRDREYIITSSQNGNFYYRDYATGVTSGFTIDGTSPGQFINPAALDSDNNILYSSTAGAIFNRYALGSNSITTTKTTLSNGLLLSSPTAFKASTFTTTTTTLFVGTSSGELLKLLNADATPTWSNISGNNFVGSISCIELGETESDIFVTFYNYGVTSIFYSADGGFTWGSKEGNLPDIPVRAILQNPLNAEEVIIGTDLGVWATIDFSSTNPTWYQSQDGMKDVVVTSFDLRTADNTVLATTYGRGMFTGKFTADASNLGLSVDDFTQNNLIKIYPTVSNGQITIAPTSDVLEGALTIFDINGREVHASKLDFTTGANQQLSLNLASGVYIVKFSSNEVQSTQKIIIE